MRKRIAVLPGDGIGPEVISEAIKVINAIAEVYKHTFDFDYQDIGACSIDKHGQPLTEQACNSCKESDAVLLGAIGDPKYDNDPNLKVRPEQGLLKLRKDLNLAINIRPINTYAALYNSSPLKNEKLTGVDLVIYRELIGGIYFGNKQLSADGNTAIDTCTYTRAEIERIAKPAFEMALLRKQKLTLVDKANVLETSRLWRKVVQQLSEDYKGVEVDYMYVDNAAMQLILNPSQFDVILTENLFGDVLSDLASTITGSLGMLPSSCIGNATAMFEPTHGSFPQAAGKNIANPMATILSAAMMLEYFELFDEAKAVKNAVNWALNESHVTSDINSENGIGCSEVGDLIALFIKEKGKVDNNEKLKRYQASV